MENEKNKMKHSIKNKRGRNKKGKKYGKEVIEGKHDDVPEQAFYMVGDIEEVLEKAKKMKE